MEINLGRLKLRNIPACNTQQGPRKISGQQDKHQDQEKHRDQDKHQDRKKHQDQEKH